MLSVVYLGSVSRFIFCYAECHYAECRDLFIVLLNVIMLGVIILSVVMPRAVILSLIIPSTIMMSFVVTKRR
jgi:hypothetical protein